ncbi:hypothetical protein [Celeribacter sp.]|uniref:hypothetical protein n=1 Tax=Celeribacter sp. TaxID=1890673 RepID=UPI003A910580
MNAETREVPQGFENQFILQADGFLQEAQFDCTAVSEDSFLTWQETKNSDYAFEATIISDGKGGALIMYELAKSKFRRLFQADSANACVTATEVMAGTVQVPWIDVPVAITNGEITNAQFYRLGLMDALYKDCQNIVDLRYWSPALSLPQGNFAEGLVLYNLGRNDAEISFDNCKALAKAIN